MRERIRGEQGEGSVCVCVCVCVCMCVWVGTYARVHTE